MSRAKSALELQQEAELPRLPVPPLQQTMDRFLRSAKPFLTKEEFQTTQKLVEDFAASGGVGERLQKLLEERAASTDNWLEEWWLHAAYLDYRRPLPVHSSTAMAFPPPPLERCDQLQRAAAIIAGALDFKTKLYSNQFPVERMGPYPLDSWQYFNVFGTCRVPGEARDTLRQFGADQLAHHVVVVHNKNLFSVPVYGEQGEVLNQSQILAQLTDVVAQSPHPSPTPVGILTTENRDTWSKVFKQLKEGGERSRESLDQIERALFVVCLDDEEASTATNRMTSLGLQAMHGGASNSGNRWAEKCIQFVVSRDGHSGLAYEHSPADGHPVSIMMDFIEDSCKRPREGPPAGTFGRPTELYFEVSDEVQDAILTAQQNLNSLADDLELAAYLFTGFGKEFIKSQNLSPDSFIQMALQFTFYRLHKVPGAQYETALTRRFLHGRTETIRSCSLESVLFARTMLDPAASDMDKAGALRAAIQGHKEYVIEAMSGQGVDRHLLGLRLAAAEVGMEVPQLFLDAGYIRSGHMRLSTSQVNMRCRSYSFFGPVVPDGYGCCYNPHAEQILFSVSAFRSCPETSAAEFCRALEQSLGEMMRMLTKLNCTLKT